MAFCTECGADIPADVRFCTFCGNPMSEVTQLFPVMAAASAPAQAPTTTSTPNKAVLNSDLPPAPNSKYAVMGTGAYICTMLLYCIPVIGWLACIIMAFAAKNQNKRNFSRAMLVFLIIGMLLSVVLYFAFNWAWYVVQEYIQQYISEATNGSISDFNGLKDLFDIFKELDGLELPSMPNQ